MVAVSMKSLLHYLSPAEKSRGILMFVLQIIASLLDLFGLASLMPVVMLAPEPGSVQKSKLASWLYTTMNFHAEKAFLVFAILFILSFFLLKKHIYELE